MNEVNFIFLVVNQFYLTSQKMSVEVSPEILLQPII